MKLFVISDNVDTQTGMRLAGTEGVVVHEREEFEEAVRTALNDKEIGVDYGETGTGVFGNSFRIKDECIAAIGGGNSGPAWYRTCA